MNGSGQSVSTLIAVSSRIIDSNISLPRLLATITTHLFTRLLLEEHLRAGVIKQQMTTTSRPEIILAYRHIYKSLLRAVQYSKPARFVVKDRVRDAFRKSQPDAYDSARIARTLEFLDGATRAKGLEHRILKNLMHVWWEQKKLPNMQMCVSKRFPWSCIIAMAN